jgi:hypothetical protein
MSQTANPKTHPELRHVLIPCSVASHCSQLGMHPCQHRVVDHICRNVEVPAPPADNTCLIVHAKQGRLNLIVYE